MKLSKTLGPVLIAGSALLLSACGEEESLERSTAPTAISGNQALLVLEDVGGLALKDSMLAEIALFGTTDASALKHKACAGGSRSEDVLLADPDYDKRVTFSDCTVGAVHLNGSLDMHKDGSVLAARFSNIVVTTNYEGGQLRMVMNGSLHREFSTFDNTETYALDVPQLTLEATVTQYARSAPVRIEIRDYLREKTIDLVTNDQSLSVSGRLTKSGDYGTYDVQFSNVPVTIPEADDVLRKRFTGKLTSNVNAYHFDAGRLYVTDLMQAGSWLSVGPSAYIPAAGSSAAIEAGKYLRVQASVKNYTLDTLLEWTILQLPILVKIFE